MDDALKLRHFILAKKWDEVDEYLEKGDLKACKLIDEADMCFGNSTVLHHAAEKNMPPYIWVKLFNALQNGMGIDIKEFCNIKDNFYCNTALHVAAKSSSDETAFICLSVFCDINSKNITGPFRTEMKDYVTNTALDVLNSKRDPSLSFSSTERFRSILTSVRSSFVSPPPPRD